MADALTLQMFTQLHNPWRARAHTTAGTTITTGGGFITVPLSTVDFDPQSMVSGNTIVVAVAGYYQCNIQVKFSNVTAAGRYEVACQVNAVVAFFGTDMPVSTTGTFPVCVGSDILKLNAGDAVSLVAQQTSASNQTLATGDGTASNYISLAFISPL